MEVVVTANKNSVISEIDQRIFGSFIEHMGRAIYSGIYEPEHPSANIAGFRRDVIDLVKELAVPVVRYPGGNFVSAYQWEDGIGPQAQRPVRLDLAWHSSESNQVGIHEFADWAQTVGCDMMLAVNLGSRGLTDARNFLEYVNHPKGSYWSDLRRENGQEQPWGVKTWCLGNEMDGPWQIGQKTADEYGRIASETAKAMRAFDKNLELVVCGSSSPDMPTFPSWEKTVLEHTYEVVDYISLHMYFKNHEGHTGNYLAQSLKMERYIDTVASTINYVKAQKHSDKQIYISFDEWNVWYHSTEQDKQILNGEQGWPHAPAILEDIYNVEDALLVACLINSFIRKSDIVKIACLAQLVNVIAPIMTEKNGAAWRQTIFYPFMLASRYGRGQALKLDINSPCYAAECAGEVPYVDISAVYHEQDKTINLFVVNRHSSEAISLNSTFNQFQNLQVCQHQTLNSAELQSSNSSQFPERITLVQGEALSVTDQELTVCLAPLSYHFIQLKE